MAMGRGRSARSLVQQAFALHASFPEVRADLSPKRLIWRGTITPTALSRAYRVSITYRLRQYPEVQVLAPALETRPGESIPHLFSNGTLCLHLEDEWSPDMLVVDTTVPWTSEWLLNYELWLATGSWYGGGEWPPPRQANSTVTSNMARAERRRASRQPR
jgi:hypothetical protein